MSVSAPLATPPAIPQPPKLSAELVVTSFHPSPVGGGILLGRDGQGRLRRALIPAGTAGRSPQDGETWRVTGPERTHAEYGPQLHAEVALPLLPTGSSIVRFLATNRRFEGVGWKTAGRLWDALGEQLYDALARRELVVLAEIVGPERAVRIAEGFGLLAEEVEVFRWLDRYGVSPRTAAAAASIWGRGAIPRIEADPYALALLEPWAEVDARAMRMGLALDDERRLMAALEEALSRRYKAGHTAATAAEVEAQLRTLLGFTGHRLGKAAVRKGVGAGRAIEHPDGLLQSRAGWFMEREIERMIGERLAREAVSPDAAEVEAAIARIEAEDGHALSPRQREAVRMAVSHPVSVLCGGAGTGKTTTVRGILDASERRPGADRGGFEQPQVALAGRAAKRIAEATGRKAATIARFLRRLEAGASKPPRRGLAIVDEGSMVDVPSLYRFLAALPPAMDLLFVGDPGQLPPIGPGLPFHAMVASGAIPKVELDVVHRQASRSGIPAVAQAIRNGRLPDLPRFDPRRPATPGVFLAPAGAGRTGEAALEVFGAMAGPPPHALGAGALHGLDIQVLCPLKRGPDGYRALNDEIERRWMVHQPRVGQMGVSLGSKLLWLKNDYSKAPFRDAEGDPVLDAATGEPVCAGFMNGALGVVRRRTERGAWVEFDDGAADEIRLPDLVNLTRGWAISVHKAQGSAFRKVVVPFAASRILDRALVYTAVTRAVETVVLVGDPAVLRSAVEAEPKALARRHTLCFDRAPFHG